MDFGYLKLLVALLLAECVWTLPLGCQDNGTSYKDGEVVRAREPCLSCVCRRGALACSLRVCADYVDALPPGCFLVHKPNDCCPRLLCEGGFDPNGIELRTAVKTAENNVDENGCVVNGTVYGEGSAVASWDPCEYCYCTESGIKCVKPRCVQPFEGCEAVYEKFSCCPTRFDCRDAKVGFLTTQAKEFGIDSEPEKGDLKVGESDRSPTSSEEKTTEDFAVATTEDVSSTDHQPETATPSSPDNPTTLRLHTTEMSTGGLTEETTPAVTTDALSRTEEEGEQASEALGAGSGSLPHSGEPADGNPWNSSGIAEDYDAYDYGEPELPPSLPNLVIFPFVAADAVVKDDGTERHEAIQVERTDDQAPIFKDYFSPPTRTEGGFVPKRPSPEPFYEVRFPFPRKELSEQPTEPLAKGKQTVPPQTLNEAGSSFDESRRTEMELEDILGGNIRRSPFGQVLRTETGEFLTKGNSEPFRKSQQTKKPVTVAYKNVVVDFYPDHLVTTTRSHSTTQSEVHFNATDASHQLRQRNPTTPVSLNAFPHLVFGFADGKSTLAPPRATQELPTEETRPSVVEATPTSVPEESFFEQFLKSLMESNTSTMIAFTASNKHKYSSKIKGRLSTTTKPKRGGGAAGGQPKIAASVASTVASSGDSATTFHSLDGEQFPNEGPVHSLTTLPPALSETENLPSPKHTNVRGHHIENGPYDSPDRSSTIIHSDPGTLLKLAGCNIYGMMYRIGKVITELSGPCRKCLCTDLGVQCSPLEC